MGQQELEAALRREGDEKAREIWQQVEKQAELLRGETSEIIARQQLTIEARREREVAGLLNSVRSAARQKAQRVRLLAESTLAERLKLLSAPILESLALQGGQGLFLALASEIPEYSWCRVAVHSRDLNLAKSRFPSADITTAGQISGGLKVEDKEGRTVIVNSLEKRFEHLWPELLPEIFNDLRQRLDDHEAAT